jgi:hypothetical protein
VYFGYLIDGGELKIDPTKMEAIMKWIFPTNVTKVRSFAGEKQYLQKFIASFKQYKMSRKFIGFMLF